MSWSQPVALALVFLALLPLLQAFRRRRAAWPSQVLFASLPRTWRERMSGLPTVLRALVIACLAVSLAGPRQVGGKTRISTRGVAIVAALDRSSSMKAVDRDEGAPGQAATERTRLDAARETFRAFADARPDDLIGLVGFANYPDVLCPPTLDREFLAASLATLKPARPGEDGTNLGDALIWSMDALRVVPARKKVLILLTDGRNDPAVPKPANPREAADLARTFGVTLHTVAIGRAGGQVRRPEGRSGLPLIQEVEGPDLELLRDLAMRGGGKAFEAANPSALPEIFAEIDGLERSPFDGEVRLRYEGTHLPWLLASLGILSLERVLCAGLLRRHP